MNSSGRRRRMQALVRKETRQLLRDRSNLAVGLILPVVLILLFGFGLSFDLIGVKMAVVQEDHSPQACSFVNEFNGNLYLQPALYPSMQAAEQAMLASSVEAILRIPPDFSQKLAQNRAEAQLLVNGVLTTNANSIESYVNGIVGKYFLKQHDLSPVNGEGTGSVNIVQRMWFNEPAISTWYLVPGLIVLVLTLIGAFLTSLLIVRERERGTLEALYVTPARSLELVVAKLIPYLVIGLIDLMLCLLAASLIFDVPMRGSLVVIVIASTLYLVVSLSMGLLISGRAASQFQASQIALLTSFMPAMMLSGFVYDLSNVPAIVQTISQFLPATHFMPMVKTLFLVGNDWSMVIKECSILCLYALFFINAARMSLRKRIE
ncbi:membrane protein [Desulfosarcina widdelii]|uniref:Transport permease protein n=1 Tax=Desulfosarcina widdelii TaxID=947919 RepID=A0A5K7YTB4_9BACT|nr:ABC transporter permease [Desulfosarcina widdelii]BBO73072.1 membrane protein [Desulfosarcina widdelii]